MKKANLSIVAVISLVLLVAGCRKDVLKNIDQDEARVYITKADSSVDFSNYQTFRIADSVSVIKDGQLVGHEASGYDQALLTAISQAMVERGFQLESDQTKAPDLGIQVSRITTDYTGIV